MDEQAVLLNVESGVAIVTLNEREKKNAFTDRLLTDLVTTLEDATSRSDVRVIVITGSNGWFSVGGDLSGAASHTRDASVPFERSVARLRNFMRSSKYLRQCSQTTIAAVNGPCAGAGLALATACDLRFSVDSAVFRTAFIDAARSGDFGGTWLLTRLLGEAKAKELYLLNEKVRADEAARIGLVSRTFPKSSFDAEISAIAASLAAKSGTAMELMKQNLNASHLSFAEAIDAESARHVRTTQHPNAAEAAAAFLEKREPRFND